MKKHLPGLLVGLFIGLLLFGNVPALADSVKSLVGIKVTGVYTIEQGGKKIAEGAILDGSAYVPVRVMAEATGTPLSVEGKVIKLGETSTPSNVKVDELNIQKTVYVDKIKSLEGTINNYETDVIPRAELRYDQSVAYGNEVEINQRKQWLTDRTAELTKYKADLSDAQKKLAVLDAAIAAIEK